MSRPVLIQQSETPNEAHVAEAVATLRGLLDEHLLVVLALHLDAVARERLNGGLDVMFDTNKGRVCAMRLSRRGHYYARKSEAGSG